ncbi:hypothetical protein NH621_10170 [Lactococcus formosensis]|uniref:hypothetical protein n=1 Tax=Lactococcus formosensis TaxID=1281486 RepID=UPI0020982832|nr:hypothetical protein [Lactococcus formosensis]MCO7181530.1 hypothetical protein [Lactococcus formosensis]
MEYADDRKIQPDRITYRLIQEYIEEKYGFKVHTANIAEVKRNLGCRCTTHQTQLKN